MSDSEYYDDDYDTGAQFSAAVWRRLGGYAWRYKNSVLILAGAALATAAVDVAFPLLTRALIDDLSDGSLARGWVDYAAWYFFLTVMLCLSVGAFIFMGGRIRTHVSHDIREDGFANLQRLSFSFFDKKPVGWLMARMTSDCERLSNILAWGILDLVWGVSLMIGIVVAMFAMQPALAVWVLAVLPLLAVASAWFKTKILGSAREVRRTNSRITGFFNESISGVRTTKVFNQHARNLRRFQKLSGRMFDASVRNAVQSALFLPVVLTIGSLATACAMMIGGFGMLEGSLTVGTLIAFLAYIRHFFDPVQELAHWFAEMQMAQASAERIIGLIETHPEIHDSERVRERLKNQPESRLNNVERIELRDLEFEYLSGEPVIKGVNLIAERGQTIALVGRTGGGKSSLVNLICRFYEPTSGQVLVNGRDYRELGLAEYQSRLGVVLQTPHVFSGSVMENIRYGRLDATDEEVKQAADIAGAHTFIQTMADGYQFQVGEAGSKLSTGQKQLLAFARAILADPQVLVMDEATASVDTQTERLIQERLGRVLAGRISFVIAHRLSTIRAADRILVVENGRIVESGSHRELLACKGRYFRLYTEQALRESSTHLSVA
jgi:ATP-binding cassette subfamily B protein